MLPSSRRLIVAAILVVSAAPLRAADDVPPVAPSAAVAAAWAREGALEKPVSTPMKAMMGAYAAIQALDMASTIRARQAGGREVNPLMKGSYGQATAVKALLSAGALGAARMMAKKNGKAALVTMIALNVAGAAVVARNMKNAHQLNSR